MLTNSKLKKKDIRILCKSRLNDNPLTKRRKQRKYIRFERKFPNELWQIGLKIIENEGMWLISIFDDPLNITITKECICH
ncbi:MAG TPA: hypothetical protein VFV86_13455 [Nitrososphaeraceae archaeon]|nr:hypothetical protein [Nitrososphaeraceae archaeon]